MMYNKNILKIPITIADNAGYDSAQLAAELRAAHSEGKSTFGLGKLDYKSIFKFKSLKFLCE